MSNVTFWSPFQRSGTTSNLISVAFMIGLTQRLRVLAMHVDYAGDSLEAGLPIREPNADFFMNNLSTTGWDAMYRLYSSGSLTKEKFRDCTTPLLKNQLDLLPGRYKQTVLEESLFNGHHVSSISKLANEAYDLVLLDAGNGKRMEREIVKDSDVMVVNLNQNMRELEHFFRDAKWKQDFEQKKVIITLGLYDRESNCTPGNIKRRFGYKDPIVPIPYCTPYREAWNRRETGAYVHQTMNLDKKNGEMGEHATSIRELSKIIMESAGLRSILKQLERGA
ncbi:hypothetical protein [Paenibacillus sp. Marseille-Q4541]|uniref:hypothetical protein n=1 Tax=Paenibacillus sp. Marseille-Q4541 TaxID=2831522 RepID=UPI001BA47B23|nr:hypothetical protein [Paenibacillus sp. Marseille-Q4541]